MSVDVEYSSLPSYQLAICSETAYRKQGPKWEAGRLPQKGDISILQLHPMGKEATAANKPQLQYQGCAQLSVSLTDRLSEPQVCWQFG